MKKVTDTPTVLVVFGATGNLAAKKIFPSLYHLYEKKKLPELLRIIGFSRRDWDDSKFRNYLKEVLEKHQGEKVKDASFYELFTYKKGNFENESDYKRLSEGLGKIDDKWEVCANKLFYLAVPPKYYKLIFDQIEKTGLSEPCSPEEGWTRVLVEKPFGRDEDTANELDTHLAKLFKEEQVYRIDHYLGKEMLQNILAFRFANNIFDQAWNNVLESINIKLLEEGGIEDRGTFYDGVGALRDVGQNHLLQMLALVTMDQPTNFNAEDIRKRRGELLELLKLPSKKDIKRSVRGQYKGYRDTEGVSEDSKTETYFRVGAQLEHPKWQGVPITLESGKNMDKQVKEVVVTFKHPEPCLCPPEGHYQNKVIFSLEPVEEIRIEMFSKKPGLVMETKKKTFNLPYRQKGGKAQYTEEYEKLLLDAIKGDQTLFISSNEVQAMWKYIDPFVDGWKADKIPLIEYERGEDIKEVRKGMEEGGTLKKEIGIIGLGKMGSNLSKSLIEKGWKVVGYNKSKEATKKLEKEGLAGADSLEELVDKLTKGRVIWIMVPAGKPVTETVKKLKDLLDKGDIVIDGGNSFYEDSIKHAETLKEKAVEFVDVGVSGGPDGARYGASLMVGGNKKLYEHILPLYKDIAVPGGHEHFDGVGAGHFVKMVHNGIEYGMMQSIAEGFDLLRNSEYKLHLKDAARVYNNGSVIESRLVSWMVEALEQFGEELNKVSGKAQESGEGRWSIEIAKKLGVKVKVIENALKAREESREKPNYQGKIIQALRNRFGGHPVQE